MDNEHFYIVLADDDESDQFLFKEAFDDLKIKTIVNIVNNGTQLMNYLNQEDTILPGLIFLDLNMPRKNGLQCLKEIRSSKKLKNISIAIYSTSDYEKDIDDAFNNGANVYIKKPDDFTTLKQVLNKAVVMARQYHYAPFNKANFLLKV